jgi:O-glycosyl hydrolase
MIKPLVLDFFSHERGGSSMPLTKRSRAAHLTLLALSFISLLSACAAPLSPTSLATDTATPRATVNVEVNGAIHYQTFLGFGASLEPWELKGSYHRDSAALPEVLTGTDHDKEAIARLLFTELGIHHARLFLGGYEPSKGVFDWSAIQPHTDFIRLAKPHGLQMSWATFTLDNGPAQQWFRLPGSACVLDPSHLDDDVEWIVAAALHFRDLGMPLPYLAINNEPDFGWCQHPTGSKISVQDYLTIAQRLGQRLRAEGLDTQLVVSDGLNPQASLAYMEALLANPGARQYVGALAYHSYADPYPDPAAILRTSAEGTPSPAAVQIRQHIGDLAKQHHLPVWMTEVCVCAPPRPMSDFELGRARVNHVFDELTIGNVSVFDAMNLFLFDRPGVRDELVHLYFRQDGSLERYVIAPYGYLLGHFAKFIVAGSVRLNVQSSDSRVRLTAFQRPDGTLALVGLNNNPLAIRARVSLSGLATLPATMSVVSSREGALWREDADTSVQRGEVSVTLAPLSVTTLVSR